MEIIFFFITLIAGSKAVPYHRFSEDRMLIDESNENFNKYGDILDSYYGVFKNNDKMYTGKFGVVRIDDGVYDDDGFDESEKDGFYDIYDDYIIYGGYDEKDLNKNGIHNNNVGINNDLLRGRRKLNKAKLLKMISGLMKKHTKIGSTIVKLFAMRGKNKDRVNWRKWLNWYKLGHDSVAGVGKINNK